MELAGTHVLVTGASRGIGAALATAFSAVGARPTMVARSKDALDELARTLGGFAIAADLSQPASLRSIVARATDLGGPVDVLVNNVGIDDVGALHEDDADSLERLVHLNVLAAMELSRQALPGMIARGRGHIVLISSAAALGAFPGMAAYSASKAAMSHFAAGLRADLRGLPLVQVGFVTPTDMLDRIMEYPPAKAARRRFTRLGLLADTDRDRLASAVVTAVAHDRRRVTRPRRLAGFATMAEIPRRLTELLLSGVPPRRPGT